MAIANEAVLYLLLAVVLGCECLTLTSRVESEIFGWIMVALVTLAVHMNVCVVVYEGLCHGKLIYTWISNYRNKFNSKKAQVVPRKTSIDIRNEQGIRINTNNDEPLGEDELSRIR